MNGAPKVVGGPPTKVWLRGGAICRGWSAGGGVVVVAEDATELPGAVFVDPEHGEGGFAGGDGVFVFEEAVGADLDGADALHGVDLEGSGGKLAGDVAADVFADALGEGGVAEGDAALVVVELDVVGDECGEPGEVAAVVGVEEGGVEGEEGGVEFGWGVDLVERKDGGGLGGEQGGGGEGERQGEGGEEVGHG